MIGRRLFSMALKESFHILRDPFTLIMALILPLFLVVIFGSAIDFNLENIPILVDDRDQTETSRSLISSLKNSGIFNLKKTASLSDPEKLLKSEKQKAIVIINPQLEKNLSSGKKDAIQILLDGADNTTAGSLLANLRLIQIDLNKKLLIDLKTTMPSEQFHLTSKVLFNPELKTEFFIVPGLTVVVTAIISILLTALTIAKEWEQGSMELLLSTPINPLEIILGKILPYTMIGLWAIAFVYFAARFGFGIPFRGSHFLFFLASLLFLSACLSQGILISIIGKKQVISMQFSMISGLLPSLLLSGFIFPIESMPPFFYYLTSIFPARWFMVISRHSFLNGELNVQVYTAFAMLILINIVLIKLAVKKFKRNLE